MAESANGAVAGKEQDVGDRPTSGVDTPAQGQSQQNMEIPAEETSVQSSSHGIRWLVLLLIIIAVLPLGWFLLPENTRHEWAGVLMNRISPQKISDVDVTLTPQAQVEVPAPAAPNAALTVSVTPKETTPEPLASETSETVPPSASILLAPTVVAPHSTRVSGNRRVPPTATSEEVKGLMAAMGELQSSMQTLQDKQVELRRELHDRQQLELRTRLRRIASARTLLPQMTDFWQDITFLPLLSESERNEAKTMRKLAANDTDKLNAWSIQLKRLAATLPVPEHQDIIPKPEQPAFSWFAGKFHLRPVPTPEQQALSKLRTRLLETVRVLTVEMWPEPKVWRHLLADLREQFGDDVDLSLPERLDGIQQDIATMRAKAASWLENI